MTYYLSYQYSACNTIRNLDILETNTCVVGGGNSELSLVMWNVR